ncbi:MAG TPA: ion transporter [bacterium]|nr:ion transporter [bacterium]HPP87468.1 ion transporter [bacterium]
MKKILFSIWNFIISIVVILAVILMLRYYFEVTPAKIQMLEKYQLFITILFIFDVIIRLSVLKIEYLKSSDFVIDIISCIDIISALKIFRIFRFARILRFLRIVRILKFSRIFEQATPKIRNTFNFTGLAGLIVIISLGLYTSKFIRERLIKSEINYTYTLLKISLNNANASTDSEFSYENFIMSINNIKNLLKVEKTDDDGRIIQYNTLNLATADFDKYLNDNFFQDDLLNIEYQNIKTLISIKNLNHIANRIEFYSLMFAIFYYVILFAIFYFLCNDEK